MERPRTHEAIQVVHLASGRPLAVIHCVSSDVRMTRLMDQYIHFDPALSVSKFYCSCNAVRELQLHNSGEHHSEVVRGRQFTR